MNRIELERLYNGEHPRYLDELSEFLRIPSISSDPEHAGDCRACADWLVAHLSNMGFSAQLLESDGHPIVFAERPGGVSAKKGASDAPTVLFYGHYDVQPVDPLDSWSSPPFAPEVRGDRLHARGAADDKGQVFYVLKAIETLIKEDALGVDLKIVLEGEEESGSTALTQGLERWKDLFKADILMVADTTVAPSGAPAVVMGLRGIIGLTLRLQGPDHDLHSGIHGGVAPNPAQGIASVVSSMFNDDGSIAVDGFLADIREPSLAERAAALSHPLDPAAYEHETGAPPVGGTAGIEPTVRTGFMPTIDINGLHGGHSGNGMKTIIPATASVKISARIVPDQDPVRTLDALVEHIYRYTPPGLRVVITERCTAGSGFRLDPESPRVQTASAVLHDATGEAAVLRWEGASIPVIAELRRASGAEPLMVGFSQEADHIHAPDESFALSHFRSGYLYAALLLQRLAHGSGDAA